LAIQIGDTYYWKDGGHLWVVISDPLLHGGDFVAVNLTTDWFVSGSECELSVGDHSWVTEKTYVNFGKAMKLGPKEESNLTKQIALGTVRTHSPMSPPMISRIVTAAKTSKALAPRFKLYI
jgi:hypothetical protein